MASLTVFNSTGAEVGKYDIDPGVFAANINRQLLHDAVVMYQANLRQGTMGTKSRGMVAGSTKKMYRQKGTGNARAGSRRSGIRRGGGHIFRKDPRDFGYRLPRKALQLATRMALAARIQDNEVLVIDELTLSAPKTSQIAGLMNALKIGDRSVLVATSERDNNLYLSARNIQNVTVSPVAELNALTILKPRRLLMTRAALDSMKAAAEQVQAEKAEATKA
ncbi:MAG: 50S ribosomal protein L4 [Planctomycetota bacterium]|nr:50S ribosomal protein L4 [Planctomycetota bacterium]